MTGGEVDNGMLHDAFLKMREDMSRLGRELEQMKQEHRRLHDENTTMKTIIHKQGLDEELISKVVRETMKNISPAHVTHLHHETPAPPQPKHHLHPHLLKKINKNRKTLIYSRIGSLAEKKSMTASEIKDLLVDHEMLCSKATFYRYLDKMRQRGMIDLMKINEMEVVVKI